VTTFAVMPPPRVMHISFIQIHPLSTEISRHGK